MDMASCILANTYQHFGAKRGFLQQRKGHFLFPFLKMKSACASEIIVPVYQRRRHHTQASSIVYSHGSENLKPDSNLSKNLAMTQGFCNKNSCSNIMSVNLKPKA